MTYYNTTAARGLTLAEYRRKAAGQDVEVVMAFMFERRPMTPEEVQASRPCLRLAPLTSIRRSITNLTAAGVLEKLPIKRKSKYGRPAHCWRLVPTGQPDLFDGGDNQ